ncbi:hypothetical protein FRC18_006530 [Serendipita sp. 400]|nr:hypothetical protein FRC18_006530 [Serendipita sp. 400]
MAQTPTPQVVSFPEPLLSPPLLSPRTESKYGTPQYGTPTGQSFVPPPSASSQPPADKWRPLILTPWILITLCVTMLVAAIGLEVAYFVTNKRNGWGLPPDPTHRNYIHYADTWIPVTAVMVLVSAFTAADYFLMKMVPFMELNTNKGAKGDTLLLDYTGEPKYLLWIIQINNRHWLPAISTIICLLLLGLQPLASSLVQIRETEFVRNPIGVPKFGTVGVNDKFATLEGFASAAGFAEADSRYDLGRPPFVWRTWAVDEFERPTAFISNGTMKANTNAIQTLPNCVKADTVNFARAGTGYQLTGSWAGCPVNLNVDSSTDLEFGVDVVGNCTTASVNSLPAPVKPVVFWFASTTYSAASLVFCTPELTIHDVKVTVNLATGELINVEPLGDYAQPTNVTSGPPLNGQVWNGVRHDVTGASADTLLRDQISRLQLAQSVMLLLQKGDLKTNLQNTDTVVNTVSTRYALYLALSARSNYFVTDRSGDKVLAQITEIQQRLWLSYVPFILALPLSLADRSLPFLSQYAIYTSNGCDFARRWYSWWHFALPPLPATSKPHALCAPVDCGCGSHNQGFSCA